MRIRELDLENIGVFDSEKIVFKPCPSAGKAEIHILTGQNGSGKSTILMALANLFNLEHFQEFEDRPELASQSINLYLNSFYKRLRPGRSSIRYSVHALGQSSDFEFNFTRTQNQFTYNNKFNYTNQIARLLIDFGTKVRNRTSQFRYSAKFVAFAMSGYRRVKDESVNAILEPREFNPLWQAVEFDKVDDSVESLSINQLLANNISKSAIERGRDEVKANRFAEVVRSIEVVIGQITGWKIQFDLRTDPTTLVTLINDREVDFDTLPDGLKSLVSWVADVLCRVDLLNWRDSNSILEKDMVLFLDEIEVHLHPEWQRKVLPVIQSLFKNAQVFVSTHSPFVINSVDDAWVYKLKLSNGKATVGEVLRSEDGISYQTVLSDVLGVKEEFGGKTQDDLERFFGIIHNGTIVDDSELLKLAASLASQSEELNSIVQIELNQLNRRRGKELTL